MKLATTTEDFLKYVETPAQAVKLYKGTGFRYLDYSFSDRILKDNWLSDIFDARNEAEKLGIKFVQAHSPNYNPLDENTDHEAGIKATIRSIEACAELGIKNIVVHSGCTEKLTYCDEYKDEFFSLNLKFYRSLFPVMEKHGINALIENSAEGNMKNKYFFMSGTDMREFIDYVNHPLVHACWDTGHANMRGSNQYDDIYAIGKELYALHVQDNFGEYDEHIAPMMGTINMDAVMQALLSIGYKGYFTFEAVNMLIQGRNWPHKRKEWNNSSLIYNPSVYLKRNAVILLYEIGKYILDQYNCFEC